MDAQKMRNDLVYGITVYKQSLCEITTKDFLKALDDICKSLKARYDLKLDATGAVKPGWYKVKVVGLWTDVMIP